MAPSSATTRPRPASAPPPARGRGRGPASVLRVRPLGRRQPGLDRRPRPRRLDDGARVPPAAGVATRPCARLDRRERPPATRRERHPTRGRDRHRRPRRPGRRPRPDGPLLRPRHPHAVHDRRATTAATASPGPAAATGQPSAREQRVADTIGAPVYHSRGGGHVAMGSHDLNAQPPPATPEQQASTIRAPHACSVAAASPSSTTRSTSTARTIPRRRSTGRRARGADGARARRRLHSTSRRRSTSAARPAKAAADATRTASAWPLPTIGPE